jgi:hypothetical protein
MTIAKIENELLQCNVKVRFGSMSGSLSGPEQDHRLVNIPGSNTLGSQHTKCQLIMRDKADLENRLIVFKTLFVMIIMIVVVLVMTPYS